MTIALLNLFLEKIPPVLDFTKDVNIVPLYNIDFYEKEIKFRLQVAYRRAATFVENAKLNRQKISNDHANPVNFSLNDLVLLNNEAGHKLDSIYKGPFKVIEIRTDSIKIEDDMGKTELVHKNRLKKYVLKFLYSYKVLFFIIAPPTF